jgi:phosphoenolpyruvate carboxykinase (GTP)
MIQNKEINEWIENSKALLKPSSVVWIDGSKEQYDKICEELVADGIFTRVNPEFSPNSYYGRSNPNDVARVEGRTYICSKTKSEAGPTNNWADPSQMKEKLNAILDSSMEGRTMYVIPYLMGPAGSSFSKVGFELSDSAYVVANMYIMARVGKLALEHLEKNPENVVKGIHSTCEVDPDERYIAHFPDTLEIISVNTNYGGNALQGKKCFALRLASIQGKNEGWLAEHMLILSLTNPQGEKKYIAAAFPSACGKTNLAMIIPPQIYSDKGWKVETLGDDIAWLRFGDDNKLYATNPENGFFGVASGTAEHTNPTALEERYHHNLYLHL